MADTELQDAIDSAALEIATKSGLDLDKFAQDDADRPNDGTVKVPAPKREEVESDDEPEQESETDETEVEVDEGLTADQIKEARVLYKALLDPEKKIEVLTALAKHAGVLKDPIETKADVKEAKKTVLELMREGLPENMKFLADTLSPALERVLEAKRQEDQVAIQELQNQRVYDDMNRALSDLSKETKGESRKVEPKMVALMEKFPVGPKTTMKEYLRALYTLASGGTTAQKVKSEINDKINKNAKDTPNRLKSAGDRDTKEPKPGEGKKGLNNVVNDVYEAMLAGKIK